ncbi:MAG TPA: aminotransferase class I/II-fold pyridoxal phosphate-dependent enzyme [Streptosporangiaceae bacterium]|nr:aminotransferase class I/II-fold pyridoxal phosphate-dependent enzyme [Streptosporangiaceae bacterium]
MDAILGDCSLERLRRRKSFKWRAYPGDVLPAFVAEMDFDLAEPIKEAVTSAMADGDCGYAYKGELGEAFAAFATASLDWSPDPELVFPVPDVMTGIAEVLMALTPPGSGVVINPPVYPPFFFRLALMDRKLVEAPLLLGDSPAGDSPAAGSPAGGGSRYDLDLERLDEVLSADDVGAYLLCSPHNPVGRVWSRGQLMAVADSCARHDVVLIVDEIHAPLVLPGARQVPFLSLDHELTERVIIFTSASKGWNIPGLKCGIAVAGSAATATILQERWDALLASHLGVLASVAAFTSGRPWLDAMLARIDENRVLLARLLGKHLPAVGYAPPEASFLAWLDCRRLGLGDDPAAAFLERGRVALSPGPDFGQQGRGYARLNMGTSPDLLAEIVRRMAAATG